MPSAFQDGPPTAPGPSYVSDVSTQAASLVPFDAYLTIESASAPAQWGRFASGAAGANDRATNSVQVVAVVVVVVVGRGVVAGVEAWGVSTDTVCGVCVWV